MRHDNTKNFYETSTNYGLLWNLIIEKGKQIVCFVSYCDELNIFDICSARKSTTMHAFKVELSARGISYQGFNKNKKEFINLCVKLQLEFIIPTIKEV